VPAGASVKRYAQAAFQLALEADALDQWGQELRQVAQATSDPELRAFWEHAKVPTDQKLALVNQALPDSQPLVRNLISLLVMRGLAGRLPDIYDEYRRLLNEHQGRVQVDVTSAVPLEDAQRDRITTVLRGIVNKDIELVTHVDPSILGGLVLMVEDKLMDGSTRARLERLRRNMTTSGV
jgi:F-type H+-transporting ATPase subunit delta